MTIDRCGAKKWIWRIIMAHDFLGNELSIGDDVVFLNYNGTSASLERGKITKVSEHTAEISGKKRRAEYKIVKVNPVKSMMDNTEQGMSPNGATGDVFAAIRFPRIARNMMTRKNRITSIRCTLRGEGE